MATDQAFLVEISGNPERLAARLFSGLQAGF
jgi:hypothetical protein